MVLFYKVKCKGEDVDNRLLMSEYENVKFKKDDYGRMAYPDPNYLEWVHADELLDYLSDHTPEVIMFSSKVDSVISDAKWFKTFIFSSHWVFVMVEYPKDIIKVFKYNPDKKQPCEHDVCRCVKCGEVVNK